MKASPDQALELTPFGHLNQGPLRHIVGYQLAQATVVTQRLFIGSVGESLDLRPVEFTVLVLVEHNPDLSAVQLARALAVTPPNIKMWIDRLEQRGLVERSPHATDRRAQHIRTTRAGATLARTAAQRVLEAEAQGLSALTPGEQAILAELLQKVARCRAPQR